MRTYNESRRLFFSNTGSYGRLLCVARRGTLGFFSGSSPSPTLEDVLLQANVRKRLDRGYGLTFGTNPTKDASDLNGPALFVVRCASPLSRDGFTVMP